MNGWSLLGTPPERKCGICGKKFCADSNYVYTRGQYSRKRYFCSWKCLREFDRHGELAKGRKPKYKDEILKMLSEGKSSRQIADALHIKTQMVCYYRDRYGE